MPATWKSNVVYCGNYYTKPWTQEQSATFTRLFWSWWSRALLETRQSLVINAVWGFRKPEANIGEVISVAEHIICAPIIAPANPTRIFACGKSSATVSAAFRESVIFATLAMTLGRSSRKVSSNSLPVFSPVANGASGLFL
jgi:hypothetical protein